MKNIITISVLMLYVLGIAQDKPLTLKDAVNYALQKKAEALKAKLKVENSEYLIEEARSKALPQIGIGGNLTYNPEVQASFIDASAFGGPAGQVIKAQFGQKWTGGAGLSVNQTLFDQSVFTGLKAARSTREFYQINEQLTQEQVIENVANAYYNVYMQRQRMVVLDSAYRNTERIIKIVQTAFDNGLAKKIDLDRLVVTKTNIGTQRQQLLNVVQLQENALKFYMGMPVETKIVLPETTFSVQPLSLTEKPNSENRTSYLLLKKNEQLLQLQKQYIKATYYPTLSMHAGFNYLAQGSKMPFFATPADGVYWSSFSSVGLNLQVPIFTGFFIRSKVRQADNALKVIKLDLDEAKLGLDMAYENAVIQINNSLETIKIQKENAVLAQKVLDDTKNNYYNGLTNLTELIDAENQLTQAKNNYTTALLEYKLAEIQLIKAKGELKNLNQ